MTNYLTHKLTYSLYTHVSIQPFIYRCTFFLKKEYNRKKS